LINSQVLADILPKETLEWKLQMLKSASAYAQSRLYAIKAQTLILCRFILFAILHTLTLKTRNNKCFINLVKKVFPTITNYNSFYLICALIELNNEFPGWMVN